MNGPLTAGEPVTGLHGISACKVYPRHTLLYEAVGFYPTFSPFSAGWRTVIFCGTVCIMGPSLDDPGA